MRLFRNIPSLTLHASLVLILMGALATFFFGERGEAVVSPGSTVRVFTLEDGEARPLPAEISLDSFSVQYYPGSVAPRDYVSHLRIRGERYQLSVNKIVEIDGYRLHQSAYRQGGVSVVGVNHDPIGITLTYAGYVLFGIGGILVLANPRGRFRGLLRSLASVLLLTALPAGAVNGVSEEQAADLGRRQVLYNGRVAPLSTVATEFALKVTGRRSFRGASAERLMLSTMVYPEDWRSVEMIQVKSRRLREKLGLGAYTSVDKLITPQGQYRLRTIYGVDETLDRDILELDEKVEILMKLTDGTLFSPLPEGTPRLSDARVSAEIFYNRTPLSTIYFASLFTVGLLLLVLWNRRLKTWVIYSLIGVSLLPGVALFALRWVVSGTVPMTSGPEALLAVSLTLALISLLIIRRQRILGSLAVVMAGCMALVAHLGLKNPAITPLMPVLQSPWLGVHVSLVMMAYALLGFTAVIGCAMLVRPAAAERLKRMALVLLYPGVILLGAGIWTGAVWANVAWGRYWAWDPKETWALITFLLYAAALHPSLRFIQPPRRFALYLLLGLASILMTYVGVNYLPSLHAYA